MTDFELTNGMLEKVLGGNSFSMSKMFSFTGAYAEKQALSVAEKELNCACGCMCTDGAGSGAGSGV